MKTKNKPSIQDPLATSQAPFYPNTKARQRISILNRTWGCKGTRYVSHEEIDGENMITFGFKDLMVYCPTTLQWFGLPDIFYVKAHDFDTASSEFWARWKIYISKRFNLHRLQIDYTETTFEN